ncbi:MAG: DUF835 domain-containing protein [Thermoplasmata archaeon]|nr:DUF835 domain-containing protein [Thermoplasmata archaeon]
MTAPSYPSEETLQDDEYATAYVAGYTEGLREALREVLQNASRGHTAAEIRILAESRLARVREDAEVKRRSLLAPPRRAAWGPLLRSRAPAPPVAQLFAQEWVPGTAFLFREPQPQKALQLLERGAAVCERLLWVSRRQPPTFPATLTIDWIRPTPSRTGSEPGAGTLDPGAIAGRVADAGDGPVVVYVDALEFLATEYSWETTLRFVNWLAGWPAGRAGTVVVSVDPRTLDERNQHRLESAFSRVA